MSEQTGKVEIQCTAVKRELYRLKELVEAIPHEQDRQQGLRLFEQGYEDINMLQAFMKGR